MGGDNNLSNFIIKKNVKVNESVGFFKEKLNYNDLEFNFWFLTCKNRHLWRHHYFGAQGVIFIFSFKEFTDEKKKFVDKMLIEAENVFFDSTLISIPILLIFDVNANDEEISSTFEQLRSKINTIEKKVFNIQYIDFDNYVCEVKLGLDWLSDVMESI